MALESGCRYIKVYPKTYIGLKLKLNIRLITGNVGQELCKSKSAFSYMVGCLTIFSAFYHWSAVCILH